MFKNLLLCFLLLVLPGCVISGSHHYDEGVSVALRDTDGSTCRGAIIGSDLIVTLGHCIEANTLYVRDGVVWREATVIQRYDGIRDSVIVLRVDGVNWPESSWFVLNPDGAPALTLSFHNGVQVWDNAVSYPGDSGSPVVDSTGRLVGLIWGSRVDTHRAIIEMLPGVMRRDTRWPAPSR